jgi:hypothetical protein
VPDDRFADLGPSGTRAGDKLADLDRQEPERPAQPPRRPGRYTWVVGVAFVILIAIVMLNTIGHGQEGSSGLLRGQKVPRFAAPAVLSSLDGDPNIKQSEGDHSVSNDKPACEVQLEGAVRSCDYTSKPLVITLIVPTAECESYLDRVERMRSRFPGVNFLAVISGPRDRARESVRAHRWREPVVSDDNGALLALFRTPPYCATTVFAYRGGTVRYTKTRAQSWTDGRLAAVIRATEQR